jgi:hypothetical protein
VFHQDSPVSTAPPPPPAAKATPAKPGASPAASVATTTATTSADAEANERLIYTYLKEKNYDAFASLLADNSVEVESAGVYDKAGSTEGVKTFDASKVELSEFKVLKIDKDASLVTYVVKVPGAKPEVERNTTLWTNRNGKWLAVFHHGGTPVMKAQPAMKPQ